MNLMILSSHIFTGDPEKPWAEALATRGSQILAVGNNAEVKAAAGRFDGQIFELPGRLITPGMVDSHCHFGTLGRSLLMVDLSGQSSLSSCRCKIEEAVKKYHAGEWIQGKGWNQHQWEDTRHPTAKALDDITPDNPAMMVRACGHTVWVNTMAMTLAGITKDTPDPPGGRIERDPDTGQPSGLIQDARDLIERVMPKPSLEDWKAAMLASQEVALQFGLTGVHSFEGMMQWEALRSLDEEGRLKIRIHHGLQAGSLDRISDSGLYPGFGNDRLWLGHIKLFADGSLGAGTALLHHPYEDDPSQTGIEVMSEGEMAEKIIQAYGMGFDVAIHAIGDKAVTNALQAIAGARKHLPDGILHRDRIEHVQLFREQDLSLFRELDIAASVQPVFLPTDLKVAEQKWGKERIREGGYAWKTITDGDIPMMFGSDAPVESINPLLGITAGVARQTLDGEPEGGWYPRQKLSLEESITGFTRESAWAARKDHRLGTLKVGNYADLTVFEQDLFQLLPSEWPKVNVEMTIVEGAVVYNRVN